MSRYSSDSWILHKNSFVIYVHKSAMNSDDIAILDDEDSQSDSIEWLDDAGNIIGRQVCLLFCRARSQIVQSGT